MARPRGSRPSLIPPPHVAGYLTSCLRGLCGNPCPDRLGRARPHASASIFGKYPPILSKFTMEAGAKASTAVPNAATVSVAERRASEDSQPPAGASGWEHDDVEVVGDEAAVAIDALILLASRAPRETSVKRRRRARAAAATGALLPANARSPKDAEDQSGGWSPAAGNEKASPQVSGPGSSPEPLPGIAVRPAQPGGASDQHVSQGGQASQGSRRLPAIAELQLPTPLLPGKTVQVTPGCIQHLLSGRIDMSHASDGSARCPTTDGGGHLVAETAEPQRGAQAKDDAKLTSATVDTKVTELVSGGQKEAHGMEDGTSSPSKKQVRAATCLCDACACLIFSPRRTDPMLHGRLQVGAASDYVRDWERKDARVQTGGVGEGRGGVGTDGAGGRSSATGPIKAAARGSDQHARKPYRCGKCGAEKKGHVCAARNGTAAEVPAPAPVKREDLAARFLQRLQSSGSASGQPDAAAAPQRDD